MDITPFKGYPKNFPNPANNTTEKSKDEQKNQWRCFDNLPKNLFGCFCMKIGHSNRRQIKLDDGRFKNEKRIHKVFYY